jgi:heavy metal efflux system protein
MLEKLVQASIRARVAVLVMLALLLASGVWATVKLPIDAMPDVSTMQVTVLTEASGLSPVEVERTVTTPIENALNGVPGGVEMRSTSRPGLSAVTVIFTDATNVWFARQLVSERLRTVALPPSVSMPELAPVSTGLGEIYQFVVRSEQHGPMQLRTLLDWEIVPKLRNVPGVVEVNTQGGELKQFQVVVDRGRLQSRALSLTEVVSALRAANLNVGGGYVDRREESYTVRGRGMLESADEIGSVVVRTSQGGAPVLVRHVADVKVGAALRYGVITHDGKSEAVSGIVMMLLGANSREVVHAVGQRIGEIQRTLPPGVTIETIYDRADFVGRTIGTVATNLLEGILVVVIVLGLFLGSLRAALAVVLGIPAAMSVALIGMHALRVTGDLMSLGAIDFGFLVDGPIVIVEAVVAATAGKQLVGKARSREYASVAAGVVRPVGFAVAIIMLVYLPLLALEGVEGKMFRPMAITMAWALLGALIYSVWFFPAVLVTLVTPTSQHGPRWIGWICQRYAAWFEYTLRWRWVWIAGSAGLLGFVGYRFASAGADFVPRCFEGDAVVTIRRAPSISLEEARKLDLAAEQVLHEFPEVVTTLGMTGRAEVAVDPVGIDNTDIMVRLKPMQEWTTESDFDELSERLKNAIQNRVSGTFVSVSQPIEDRTNELISGSRADVQIQLAGNDLEGLARTADAIGKRVASISGTGDVRIERILGAPVITATADRARMARYGVQVEEAFQVLQAAREGIKVGDLYEEQRRFDIRVLSPPERPSAEAIGDMFVRTGSGVSVPLREVVRLSEGDGVSGVRHENRHRVIRVDVNLRGRDLVSWVSDAQQAVARDVRLPAGYQVAWGGQFENFERAKARLLVVVPIVIVIIFGMLLWMFQNVRFAVAVFALVPLALPGGMIGLLARGLAFSLPAAIGFIALGGVGVLNGVVIANEVRCRLRAGEALDQAIRGGFVHVVRAVLTTAAVASFGFLPMALATSAGAEVQRPLATVVVVGMLFGTVLALGVLPGILRVMLRGYRPEEEREDVAEADVLPTLGTAPAR